MHRLAIPVRKRVEVDRRCKDNNKSSSCSSSNHTTKDNNITDDITNNNNNINNDNNDNNDNNGNNDNNDDIHKRKQQKRLKVPVNDDDDDDVVMIIKDNENVISKTNQVQDNDIRTDKKRTLDEIVLIEDNDDNIVINSIKATTTATSTTTTTSAVNSNNHTGKRQSNDNNDHVESMRVLLGRSNDSSSKSNDKKKNKDLPAVTCMVCGVTIDHLDQSKREAHVNKCLDEGMAMKKTKPNNNDAIYINSDDDDDVFIKSKSTSKDHTKKGNVKQTKLVRSEKGTLKVVDNDPITSKDDAIMKNMTADEQELYTLRLQLGELSNKEAEIRSKKIQITKNIKKITRKVNQASDFKLINQENTDINEVLNILFPQVNTSVNVNSNRNSSNSNACPLWKLAQQHSAFDEVAAGKRINENSYLKIEKNEKEAETTDNNENNDNNENGMNDDNQNNNNNNSNEKSLLSQFNDMLQQDDIDNNNDIDNNDKAINVLKALIKEEIVTSLDSNKSVDDWLQEASQINALDIILEFLRYEGAIDNKEIELHLFHSISGLDMITNINRCIHMIECLLQEIVNSSNNDRQTYIFIVQFLLYYISVIMKQGKQDSVTAVNEGSQITDPQITDPPITNTIEELNTEVDTHLIDTNNNHYDDGFYVLDNNDDDSNDNKVNISHDGSNVNGIIHSAGPRSDSSFNSQHVNLSAANTFNDDDNLHDDFYGDDDSNYDNDPIQNEYTQKETETIYISDDEPVVEPLATRLLKVSNSQKTTPTDIVMNTTQVDLDLKRILYSEVEPDFECLSNDQLQLIAKNVGLKAQTNRYILIPLLQNMYQRIHNPSTQCAIASSQVISSQPASQIMSSQTASQMNVGSIDLVAYFKQNENMDLYEKIVNLIPIDVDEVHNRMKMQGYNISKDKMKALLDAGNIFFTYGKNK